MIRKLSCCSGDSSTVMSRWLASWSCLGIAACMLSVFSSWINCLPPCARYAKWLRTSVAGLLSIHPPPSTRYHGGSGSFTSTKQPVQKRWPGWRTAWPSTSGTNSVPRGTSLSAPGSLMDSSHRSFVPKCIHIVVQLFEKLPCPVYEADRPVLSWSYMPFRFQLVRVTPQSLDNQCVKFFVVENDFCCATLYITVRLAKRLVCSFSPRRPIFIPRESTWGLAVDCHSGQLFFQLFSVACVRYHSTNTPHSSVSGGLVQ